MAAALLLRLATLAPAAVAADDPAIAVRQAVFDIISFTRWPQPRPALRLCVVGQPAYAAPLFEPGLQAGGVPLAARRISAADERLGAACDVLYAGMLAIPERLVVQRRLEGFSVLTVGEPGPGCVETTMFCLALEGEHVAFATNLDAIARSGVRLNPRVLLLGRRPARPGLQSPALQP